MHSLRKWMFKPKKSDSSLLAQFYHADEALNAVAAELDSFDGRKDPERCTSLVSRLRLCQDKVLGVVEKLLQQTLGSQRASRDFRIKFPDDVLQDSLAGQLWFGAECLAAGSSIMNREVESATMRPLAKALTRQLDNVRSLLRDLCLRSQTDFSDKVKEALLVFDKLFAEFELSYVSAMVPVKTMKEYDMLQDVVILFCETVQRALRLELLTQDMIDDYDPALMFTIPRLAIICGLLVNPEGPINPDKDPMNMSEMFRPFQMLLYKIRELLWTLSRGELWLLEKALSTCDDAVLLSDDVFSQTLDRITVPGPDNASQSSDNAVPGSDNSGLPGSLHRSSSSGDSMSSNANQGETLNSIAARHSSTSSDSPARGSSSSSDSSVRQNSTISDSPARSESRDDAVDSGGSLPVVEDGGQELERGMMSHSVSTMTVVAASGTIGDDKGAAVKHSEYDPIKPCDVDTVVEDSEGAIDGGVSEAPAGCESSKPAVSADAPRSTRPRSLQKSQSWPARRARGAARHAGKAVSREGSVEALSQRVVCTQSAAGSREFTFHLPQNTAEMSDDSSDSDGQSERIMYTQTPADAAQIAFVTGALNHFFLTDPAFQGLAPPPCDIKQRRKKYCDKCNRSTPKTRRCTRCDRRRRGDVKTLRYADTVPTVMVPTVTSGPGGGARTASSSSGDWDRDSDSSVYTSDTSHTDSDCCRDDEEIALAIQAAEVAARHEARARYKSSADLIKKLFVCISGVADQLQTNYASDFRRILKDVFECNASSPDTDLDLHTAKDKMDDEDILDAASAHSDSTDSSSPDTDSNHSNHSNHGSNLGNHDDHGNHGDTVNQDDPEPQEASPANSPSHRAPENNTTDTQDRPPDWIPDEAAPCCTSCHVPFTFVRRRHHCRNCGKVFCGRCSTNSVPLPHYGHNKPVRVCNPCFLYSVTPFTVDDS